MAPSPKIIEMLIKVCGLREPENITAVAQLPVHWLGFIFYPESSRYVGATDELSAWLTTAGSVGLAQKRVGVFVNATIQDMLRAARDYGLHFIQLHGQESPATAEDLRNQARQAGFPALSLIKAFSVDAAFDFSTTAPYAGHCDYFLFDTRGKLPGGTGEKFPWEVLTRYHGNTPFLLSGGIGPGDEAAVARFNHPRCIGIDLNSRFEKKAALKDLDLLTSFVQHLPSKTPFS